MKRHEIIARSSIEKIPRSSMPAYLKYFGFVGEAMGLIHKLVLGCGHLKREKR